MGDFVRLGAHGEPPASLESWLQEGVALADANHGQGWHAAYALGSLAAYIFRPPRSVQNAGALVGVLKPAVDSVGRRFPITIFDAWSDRSVVRSPHVLPILAGNFLDQVTDALFASEFVGARGDMQALLANIAPLTLDSVQSDVAAYDEWARRATLEQAWGVVFGGDTSLAPVRAIHTIVEALAPFRGQQSLSTKVGIKLPLGRGGSAAAAFWLDIVRRVAQSEHEVRTSFWSFDGHTGFLLVQLGETPAHSLSDLWLPDPDGEYICDLTCPSSIDASRFARELPSPIAKMLEDPYVAVADFLDELRR